VIAEDGSEIEEIEAVEPLAADVRPRDDQSQRELKYLAKLRVLACLLNCKFDDLRKRELHRRQRFLMSVAIFLTMLMLGFAGLTLWALQEKSKAEAAQLLALKNEQLAKENAGIAEVNEQKAIRN
jgi:Tfp pilus assembly protein PilN